jgi:hypothetical protein
MAESNTVAQFSQPVMIKLQQRQLHSSQLRSSNYPYGGLPAIVSLAELQCLSTRKFQLKRAKTLVRHASISMHRLGMFSLVPAFAYLDFSYTYINSKYGLYQDDQKLAINDC